MDGKLVSGHHDGSVGDLTNELGHEATVEPATALVAVDGHETGPETSVARSFLAETCACDLC